MDTARRAVAELAASQHRAFTRSQAAGINFTAKRISTAIRDGWLSEPIPGVLLFVDGQPSWEQRLHALLLATNGRGVVSHRAAARLHEFDGFDGPGNAVLELSVPRGMRFRTATSAVVHHVTPLDQCDVTNVDGFPCVTRERALAELGSVVHGVKPVRRALTSARRKGLDLGRTRATAERLHRPGQAGTGVLLRLLDGVPWEGELPATWFEELLALCLDDPALPELCLQYPIVDGSGRVVARPDIAFPAVKLGLEAHSRRFHFGPDAETLDEQRDIAAALCGWELTYLGWHATKRPTAVLAIVKELVRVRAVELGIAARLEV
jgi:putative AbiEi antitoxin of type IV toxin-antitoxin system